MTVTQPTDEGRTAGTKPAAQAQRHKPPTHLGEIDRKYARSRRTHSRLPPSSRPSPLPRPLPSPRVPASKGFRARGFCSDYGACPPPPPRELFRVKNVDGGTRCSTLASAGKPLPDTKVPNSGERAGRASFGRHGRRAPPSRPRRPLSRDCECPLPLWRASTSNEGGSACAEAARGRGFCCIVQGRRAAKGWTAANACAPIER